MYDRQVHLPNSHQPQTLTFAVSGKLWHRSLVMIDKETGSLWSHIQGEAKSGPLEGTTLEILPGLMTNWSTWRTRHPDTTVMTLSRTSDDFSTEFYNSPGQFVIGIGRGDKSISWSFAQLLEQPVINDSFNGVPLVVVFDEKSKTPFIYDRRVGGRALEFKAAGTLFADKSTGSKWDPATGKSESGPHQGETLKMVPGIVSYKFAWQRFFPN